MKIMADTIIWAKNKKELEEGAMFIFNRCKEHNKTIYRQKLELGKTIHFTGHIISDKGICPDDESWKLYDTSKLQNVKEPFALNHTFKETGGWLDCYDICMVKEIPEPRPLVIGTEFGTLHWW